MPMPKRRLSVCSRVRSPVKNTEGQRLHPVSNTEKVSNQIRPPHPPMGGREEVTLSRRSRLSIRGENVVQEDSSLAMFTPFDFR